MVVTAPAPSVWERALRRAIARGVRVKRVEVRDFGHAEVQRWLATSASRPGLHHRVTLHDGPEGVSVVCECEGGEYGRVCQHAAAVLRAAGLLPSLRDAAAWAALAEQEAEAAMVGLAPRATTAEIAAQREALRQERARLLIARLRADEFDELDRIDDEIRAIDAQIAALAA